MRFTKINCITLITVIQLKAILLCKIDKKYVAKYTDKYIDNN